MWQVFSVAFVWLASFPRQESLRFLSSQESTTSTSDGDTGLLELPVFPLRKKVKVPTDFVMLNLYEERYLALMDRVIASEDQLFGAIYAGQKPHVVRGGRAPATPIIVPGDCGVICQLLTHCEETVTVAPGLSRRKVSSCARSCVKWL